MIKMGLKFNITGLDQALANMRTLSIKAQKSIARKAARQAMNIVRDAARQNAKTIDDPATAAMIYKNIIVQESGNQGQVVGGIVMKVGIAGGSSTNQYSRQILKKVRGVKQIKGDPSLVYLPGGDTRHWRFEEFGTSHQAAHPFMRPALENNIDAVTNKFVDGFRSGINDAIQS
jgi:HK97 gp10 family phage protein